MKNITIGLLTFLYTITIVYAQSEIVTTKSGKKVVLNSDGTWKYQDANKSDTVQILNNDCSQFIQTTEDKMTGDKITAAIKAIIVSTDGGNSGFKIILTQSYKGSLIFDITVVGAGYCIDKGARINILFTDGTRLALSNDGEYNCKGKSTVYFGEYFDIDNALKQLQTKEIATMRVWTSDSFEEKDFTKKNSTDFIHIVNCLTK